MSQRTDRRRFLSQTAAGCALSAASVREATASPERAALRIWDNHCHLASFPGRSPAERMRHLIDVADRMEIERVVCFMGWPHVMHPSPEKLQHDNRQVAEAIAAAPQRALGYVYVSPEHVRASLQEIDRWIDRGPMLGIKLWVARRCSDAALDVIVARTAQLDAVVYQHTWIKSTGNLPGESTPMDLVKLARRHPHARFICGHAGGNWELGIRAVRSTPNIWLEIAGSDPTAGMVEMAVRELGPQRVVYGSDAGGRSFGSQLGKVLGARITAEARAAILGENLRRLLHPRLKRKES